MATSTTVVLVWDTPLDVGRGLLADEPSKVKLRELISEVAVLSRRRMAIVPSILAFTWLVLLVGPVVAYVLLLNVVREIKSRDTTDNTPTTIVNTPKEERPQNDRNFVMQELGLAFVLVQLLVLGTLPPLVYLLCRTQPA